MQENIQIQSEEQSNNSQSKEGKNKPKIIEIFTGSSIFRYFFSAMVVFAICFICSLFSFQIILTPVEVVGYSMLPTINESAQGSGNIYTDYVYVSPLKNVKRKDIVVIEGGKTSSGNIIIKRIIATPGDTITFKNVGTKIMYTIPYFEVEIYLNDKKLTENYTLEETTYISQTLENNQYYSFHNQMVTALKSGIETQSHKPYEFTITLGKDEYFVMGDNRNNYNVTDEKRHGSVDSRMFGPIKKSEIIGKVELQVKHGQNLLQAIWDRIF